MVKRGLTTGVILTCGAVLLGGVEALMTLIEPRQNPNYTQQSSTQAITLPFSKGSKGIEKTANWFWEFYDGKPTIDDLINNTDYCTSPEKVTQVKDFIRGMYEEPNQLLTEGDLTYIVTYFNNQLKN